MTCLRVTGILLLLLTIPGCEKEETVPVYEIYGRWDWQKSFGGFSGADIQTPESTGDSKVFHFLRNDTLVITVNGDTLTRARYFLGREESLLLHDTFDFVTVNYPIWVSQAIHYLPMRYRIERLTDTLVLAEDVYDGYGHEFVRVP